MDEPLPPEQPASASPNQSAQRTELAEQRTGMAFERMRFAADRTLMAWMRTAVSFIGFGFSIYKFFQYLHNSGVTDRKWQPEAPRELAVALIGLGLMFLLIAVIEYARFLRKVTHYAHRKFPITPSLVASVLLWVVGLLALMAVIWRTGPM